MYRNNIRKVEGKYTAMAQNKDNKHMREPIDPEVDERDGEESGDGEVEIEDIEKNTDDSPTDDNGEAQE